MNSSNVRPNENANKIEKMVAKLKSLPMGMTWLNLGISTMIPFVGTSGLEILEMTKEQVTIRVRNRRKTRNHIGQVHAAAMMLLAESVSGLVVGMNVSEESLPLIKEMNTKFIKRSTGALMATAKLLPEQMALFATEKGEIPVQIEVEDEVGETPILVTAIWAWIPKKKKT